MACGRQIDTNPAPIPNFAKLRLGEQWCLPMRCKISEALMDTALTISRKATHYVVLSDMTSW